MIERSIPNHVIGGAFLIGNWYVNGEVSVRVGCGDVLGWREYVSARRDYISAWRDYTWLQWDYNFRKRD